MITCVKHPPTHLHPIMGEQLCFKNICSLSEIVLNYVYSKEFNIGKSVAIILNALFIFDQGLYDVLKN